MENLKTGYIVILLPLVLILISVIFPLDSTKVLNPNQENNSLKVAEREVNERTGINLSKLRWRVLRGEKIESDVNDTCSNSRYTTQRGSYGLIELDEKSREKFLNSISNNKETSTLKKVSDLNCLEILTISGDVENTTPLRNLQNLKVLILLNTKISNITFLESYDDLERLAIVDNYISNPSKLSDLEDLKFLGLKNNNISDISYLSSLEKINTLVIISNNVSDFRSLRSLRSLETLGLDTLKDYPTVKIDNMPINLRTLFIKDANLANTDSLSRLRNLKMLMLIETNITPKSLTDLESLKLLDIRQTNITDGEYKELKRSLPGTVIVRYSQDFRQSAPENFSASDEIKERLKRIGYIQ